MNYTYGFPLYSSKELEKAFNYLKYEEESNDHIRLMDELEYKCMTAHEDSTLRLIIMANSKKVQNEVVNKLLPEFSMILKSYGQKHGFIIFNPHYILALCNPFMSTSRVVDKLFPYIYGEMRSMSTIWIYFDGFINKEVEQIIKLKYQDYILLGNDGKTYVRISPDENFSFIFDFIDDVISHC